MAKVRNCGCTHWSLLRQNCALELCDDLYRGRLRSLQSIMHITNHVRPLPAQTSGYITSPQKKIACCLAFHVTFTEVSADDRFAQHSGISRILRALCGYILRRTSVVIENLGAKYAGFMQRRCRKLGRKFGTFCMQNRMRNEPQNVLKMLQQKR